MKIQLQMQLDYSHRKVNRKGLGRAVKNTIFIEMARRSVFSASRRKGHSSRMRYPECCCDSQVPIGN
jgi:hypothetical protein